MLAPPNEAVILAVQSRCHIRHDHRRFDHEGTRPAHRIQKLRSVGGQLRPTGAQQNSRSQVLLQRGSPGARAIPAKVQALSRKVKRYGDCGSACMSVYAHPGSLCRDVRPEARARAQFIADGVLELQGSEMSMHKRGVLPRKVARQSDSGRYMADPVNLPSRRVECIRVERLKLGKLEKNPIGGPRPKTRAIGRLKCAAKAHAS